MVVAGAGAVAVAVVGGRLLVRAAGAPGVGTLRPILGAADTGRVRRPEQQVVGRPLVLRDEAERICRLGAVSLEVVLVRGDGRLAAVAWVRSTLRVEQPIIGIAVGVDEARLRPITRSGG